MTRRISMARVILSLSALLVSAAVLSQSLEVIHLKHRTAEEVIPVLQPLLESGGALSGQEYTLFVRAGPRNVAQLRAALDQIDREPRQLLISVRQGGSEGASREGASVSGRIGSDGGAATVRGTQSSTRTQSGGIGSVSVIEGSSAFIASGASVPIVTTLAAGAGSRPWAATSTHYRDLTNGFVVTPRVNRDGVVLDIEQKNEQLRDGGIQTQHLSTQVSAKLGQWVRLGGVEQSASSNQRGILSREYSTTSEAREVWVKVDVQSP
jgi:type II secretory pathway component GspD/PulD (secretin)